MSCRSALRLTLLALLVPALLLPGSVTTQAQTVIATVGVGMHPLGVAVNPVTNRIYVTNQASDSTSVIDGTNNTVIATIPVTPTLAPSAVAVNPATNRIYVTNALGDNVSVIDGASNTISATVPGGIRPLGVDVNPTTNRVYVTSRESPIVTVIDGATNTVSATIPLSVGAIGVGVNPTTNRIYVAPGGGTNAISVIDGITNTVVATVPVGFTAQNLAVNPSTNRVYATNPGGNSVAVIDGASNTVTATIPVGATPIDVAVNTATNRIYVTNQDNNSVSIIDGISNTVIATVPVGTTPQGIAANPATNRFYVANSGSNNVSVIQDTAAVPPPSTSRTWFFAEGSTQPPFDTWFLVQNPTTQTANVTFTFFLQPSGTVTQNFTVGPTSRFSLFANQVLVNQAFSTRIDANQPVFAERAMYVSFDGDVVTGIPAPNRLWLFAEGATVQPFQTWLLLQNPNAVPATAAISYLLESGQTVTQTVPLPANSRTSIFVNQFLPNAAFSSRVESDQPIVAERAMYRFPGNAATVNSGLNAPAIMWFLAEGRTTFRGLPADTFLLLENPNPTQATARVTLFGTDGSTTTFSVAVLPTSRLTIYLNPIFAGSFGIRVLSDTPIIAERSVFLGNEPRGAYSTQGAVALATSWNLAEGETRPPFDELIAVLNPNGSTMGVHIDFDLENGVVLGRDFTVAANSKLEVFVDDILTGANSARVVTTLPSVVERVMFISKLGSLGATDTIGFPNP